MLCLNSRERFEDNKRFLRSRIEKSLKEQEFSVKRADREDIKQEKRQSAGCRNVSGVFFATVNRAGRCGPQTVTAIGDAMGIEWAGLGLVPQKGSALFCCKGRLPQPAASIDVGR